MDQGAINKLLDALPLGVITLNEAGALVYANPRFEELVGGPIDRFRWIHVFPPEQRKQLWAAFKLNRAFGTHFEINTQIQVGEKRIPIFLSTDKLEEPGLAAVVVFQDITDQETQRQFLEESLFFSEKIAETSPDWRYVFDMVANRITWTNWDLSSYLGYTKEQLMGCKRFYTEVIHPDDRERTAQYWAELYELEGKEYREIEYRLLRADGSITWFRGRHTIFHQDEDGRPVSILASCSDISREKEMESLTEMYMIQAEEQRMEVELSNQSLHESLDKIAELNRRLEELSVTDGLTKVRNRRSLEDFLTAQFDEIARYGRPLSFIILDVDKFKMFNDSFGHQAGDTVLIEVARILKETARGSDFVARYGGEEFCIVLPETDSEAALIAAERFRAAIEAGDWTYRQVTASFGVSTFADHPTTKSLVESADQALYHSKEAGRNRVTHCDEIPKAA